MLELKLELIFFKENNGYRLLFHFYLFINEAVHYEASYISFNPIDQINQIKYEEM